MATSVDYVVLGKKSNMSKTTYDSLETKATTRHVHQGFELGPEVASDLVLGDGFHHEKMYAV